VAGSCAHSDEPSSSGATEFANMGQRKLCTKISHKCLQATFQFMSSVRPQDRLLFS
jgi:hypothetical protein